MSIDAHALLDRLDLDAIRARAQGEALADARAEAATARRWHIRTALELIADHRSGELSLARTATCSERHLYPRLLGGGGLVIDLLVGAEALPYFYVPRPDGPGTTHDGPDPHPLAGEMAGVEANGG